MKSFLERVRKRSPKSPPRARRLSKPDLIIGIDFGMTYTGEL
jgi:hypothetical protein